jgi:hypothetical protein
VTDGPKPPRRSRLDSLPAPLRGIGGVLALLLIAGAIAWLALNLTGALDEPSVEVEDVLSAATAAGDPARDPFAWQPDRRADLEQRAALGFSHVLYELSPDGVIASAKRTASFDEEIEAAASEHGVNPDLMEAMVFLESAGRPEVIAGGTDVEAAAGLGQIVASTGIDLLGMDIYIDRSQELTDEITTSFATASRLRQKAARLGGGSPKQVKKAKALIEQAEREEAEAERARKARVQVDPRFDPAQALDGMGRYLAIAEERFGREDLAVTSYHMGIGNLENVIAAYDKGASTADLPYAQLYFDTSPLNNEEAYEVLAEFEDDSATYLWRVMAAREIMRLYHDDREELQRLDSLHAAKATMEEVFHPEEDTRTFDDADELADGLDSGELVPIPEISDQLGELTDQLGVDRSLYIALRPEALAALIYLTGQVAQVTEDGGRKDVLRITSAVRDQTYQDALTGSNPEATTAYSLHTTGYSFDILRDYRNGEQAEAFQFALDRLSALGIIDYAYEPSAIHVTVSDLAEPLLEE